MFCRSYGMELASLPTKDLADDFNQLLLDNSPFFDRNTHMGGSYIGAGLKNFYWLSTGKPINYNLNWGPGEPSDVVGNENCLALIKLNGIFMYNDIQAFGIYDEKFVCESKPKINQIDLRDNLN